MGADILNHRTRNVQDSDCDVSRFYEWWKWLVPFRHSGVAFGAFLIGVFSWPIVNKFSSRRDEQKKAIEKWNDYLEIILDHALENTKQLMITLKNGKVYIGFVLWPFNPEYDRKYLCPCSHSRWAG